MLMGDDHQMQMPTSSLRNIGNDGIQLDSGIGYTQGSTIDQYVLLVGTKMKAQQETIAKTMAIHANAKFRSA